MPILSDEEQRKNWEKRIKFLERLLARNGRYKLPPRLQADTPSLTTEDLDDITDSGWRIQPVNANATLARGYPVASRAGFLEVVGSRAGGGVVMQRYTDYQFATPSSGRFIWVRHFWGGSWSPWAPLP